MGAIQAYRNRIHGVSVQDYLIHPNYTDGIKYDYMAISMDTNKTISTFFYKFNSDRYLKISNILIDEMDTLLWKADSRRFWRSRGLKCAIEILYQLYKSYLESEALAPSYSISNNLKSVCKTINISKKMLYILYIVRYYFLYTKFISSRRDIEN